MPPLTTATARVIDPILTNHARGYRHPQHVGVLLMPRANMPVRGMKRIEFGKESFILYNTKRAPGGATKRVQFGYEGKPVNLEQNSLEGVVPVEHMQEAERVPGINLGQRAVNNVSRSISLSLESDIATLARDPNTYDVSHKVALAGVNQWSDAGSNPLGDINTGKEAVRSTIGQDPNTLIIGSPVFRKLGEHPTIQDRFKYTSAESLTTDMLARYFDLDRVEVGRAIRYDENTQLFVDIWGKDAVLAFVPQEGERQIETPAYGYTYTLEGHPFVEQPYQERNAKSWFYPVTDEHSPEVVGPDAGYLIQNAVV